MNLLLAHDFVQLYEQKWLKVLSQKTAQIGIKCFWDSLVGHLG